MTLRCFGEPYFMDFFMNPLILAGEFFQILNSGMCHKYLMKHTSSGNGGCQNKPLSKMRRFF